MAFMPKLLATISPRDQQLRCQDCRKTSSLKLSVLQGTSNGGGCSSEISAHFSFQFEELKRTDQLVIFLYQGTHWYTLTLEIGQMETLISSY